MSYLYDQWLVGTNDGLYAPDAKGQWQRLGAYQFRITAFHRTAAQLLAATGSGLWQVRREGWLQLHDETLTEVMDILDYNGQLAAASAYGLALGESTAGRTRWRWLSDDLPADQRFANALAPAAEGLLVGTEGGLLLYTDEGWQTSNLQGIAVRSLGQTAKSYLAGTDAGLWTSDDGRAWRCISEPVPVYCLATGGAQLLAGTEEGVRLLDGERPWQPLGLDHTRITALAIDPKTTDHWLAGACPGGLWETLDAGRTWTSIPAIRQDVEALLAPGGHRGL